ncbi:MAG: tetratricopeptide repeat protein [Desulfuromonadales bacterium]|nr:tetratricopeptide repeat protein [Desulfuromonadales bacterium]
MMGMMDIRKLQKKLLKEELKRSRQRSFFWRRGLPGILLVLVLIFGGLLYSTYRLEESLETDFSLAAVAVGERNYQQALDYYEGIYRRNPTFHLAAQALFQGAEIKNLYQKRYPEALLDYLTLQQKYPDESALVRDSQVRIAEIYKIRQRDYPRAATEYRKALSLGVEHPDQIQYEIADSYFRQEDYPQAVEAFAGLRRDYPHSPLLAEAGYRVATVYSLLGESEAAIQTFREVTERWPTSPYAIEARFGLAAVLEERDNFAEALSLLHSLRGEYPNAEALAKKIEMLELRMKKQRR